MGKSTRGYCKYCGKEYTRTGMVKHLQTCKRRVDLYEKATETEKYFELLLYGAYNKDYWLIIQIKENATLDDLDQFIRDIWVECCGHLSAFEINGVSYEKEPDDDFCWDEPAESTEHKLKEILESDMLFGYEYDFGSTTELAIKVLNYYNAPKQSKKVVILSRNNPPEFQCSICGEHRASWINAVDIYGEEPFWCDECADKLEEGEFDEEIDSEEVWLLPVTNSPRMTQWGSKALGDQGYSPSEILRYYYGDDIYINTAEEISGIPSSWPGYTLSQGSSGTKVRQMQEQLNVIAGAYPAIPKITVDGIYGPATASSVRKFQSVFGLPVTGTVDYRTWYKISEIYVGVSRIAELS